MSVISCISELRELAMKLTLHFVRRLLQWRHRSELGKGRGRRKLWTEVSHKSIGRKQDWGGLRGCVLYKFSILDIHEHQKWGRGGVIPQHLQNATCKGTDSPSSEWFPGIWYTNVRDESCHTGLTTHLRPCSGVWWGRMVSLSYKFSHTVVVWSKLSVSTSCLRSMRCL